MLIILHQFLHHKNTVEGTTWGNRERSNKERFTERCLGRKGRLAYCVGLSCHTYPPSIPVPQKHSGRDNVRQQRETERGAIYREVFRMEGETRVLYVCLLCYAHFHPLLNYKNSRDNVRQKARHQPIHTSQGAVYWGCLFREEWETVVFLSVCPLVFPFLKRDRPAL